MKHYRANPRRACKLSSLVQHGVVQTLDYNDIIDISSMVVATRMRMRNCTILRNMQRDHARAWVSSFATQQESKLRSVHVAVQYSTVTSDESVEL